MDFNDLIKNRTLYAMVLLVILGLLSGFAGCITKDSNTPVDEEDVFTIVHESEPFNDSHVFEDGVYLGYSNEHQYGFNITNNTQTIHLNYTFQYRFEEPLVGPSGEIRITWTFDNESADENFILHTVVSEPTMAENGTIVYYDDYLEGFENLTGVITVRISGNGSDQTLTGGNKDFFILESELEHGTIL